MSQLRGLGFSRALPPPEADSRMTYVIRQRPLQRVLNFTGRTIDDVVNNPIAKNEVFGYYKLHKFIERRCEARDLERQWNPLGTPQ